MIVVRLEDSRVNSYEGGVIFVLVWLIRGWWGVLSVGTTVGIIAGFAQSKLDWIGCHLFRLCPARFGIAWRGTTVC